MLLDSNALQCLETQSLAVIQNMKVESQATSFHFNFFTGWANCIRNWIRRVGSVLHWTHTSDGYAFINGFVFTNGDSNLGTCSWRWLPWNGPVPRHLPNGGFCQTQTVQVSEAWMMIMRMTMTITMNRMMMENGSMIIISPILKWGTY